MRVAGCGPQKRQLIQQFLTEGLFISLLAAALGVLASIGLTRLFLGLAADYIPRSEEVSISPTVLLFAAGLVFLTALLPALAPLRQAARTQPTEVLTSGVRASGRIPEPPDFRFPRDRGNRFCLSPLSAGGLLVAELYTLQHAWPGFDVSRLCNLPDRRTGRPVFFFESAAAISARTFDGFAVNPRCEKCGSIESITAELLPDNQYLPGRRQFERGA